MNGPPTRIDAHDVAAARAANAVLNLQQRLAAEFGPARDDPSGLPGATGPFERMLCEILTSIKWQGEQRKLLEALRIWSRWGRSRCCGPCLPASV